eukprot:m.207042 g.207042  ORF g.207042 m.207042 type:complete len:222 (-) comp53908_c0_seq16:616-1281(-)
MHRSRQHSGHNRFAILEWFLLQGVNCSALTEWGSTSLMVAASTGSTECVAVLFAHAPDRTLRDLKGKTAQEIARQEGRKDVVKLLEGVAPTKFPPSHVAATEAMAFDQVPVDSWDDLEVTAWLKSLKLDVHLPKLLENGIKGPTLASLAVEDLAAIGIRLPPHQTLIISSLAKFNGARLQAPAATSTTSGFAPGEFAFDVFLHMTEARMRKTAPLTSGCPS